MTRNGAYPGFIIAIVGVLLFAGCAVFSSSPEDPLLAEDDTLFAPRDEAALPSDAETFAAAQEEEASEDDEAMVGLDEERVNTLADDFIEKGKAAVEQGDFMKAQEHFAHALELDPNNEEARDLFNEVSAQVSETPEAVASAAAGMRDKIVVRRTQNRIKAEELKMSGQAAVRAGDFPKAIKNFEDALLIVRWNPYLDQGNLEESTLVALLETAKKEKKKKDEAREAALQAKIYQQQLAEEQAEKERLTNKIAKLFDDANEAFLNDRYKECELYLEELLKIDPKNGMALELRKLSMDMRHSTTQEKLRREYKIEWRKTFDDLGQDNLPQTDLLIFPSDDEWERISNRGRTELAAAEEGRSPEDEAIYQKLATTPVAANFEQASLEEVVEYFRATTGVNFLISQAIIESGEEPIFDLITPPRPALDQLKLLLSLSLPPLKYKIQNGVVTVLSEEEPLGEYILDVYDIRDLSKLVQNFPAKEFNLMPSDSPEPFVEEEAEPVPDVIAAEELITLIQENIDPISWDNAENTISAIGHFLVVRQSKSVHEKINRLLNDLRASAGILVNIETRFISVDDNFLEDIGVDFRGLDGNIGDDANPLAAVPNVLLDDFGDGSVLRGYGSESNPSGIGTGNDAGFYYDDGEDGDIIGRLENLLDIELGETNIVTPAGGTTVQFTFLDDVALEAILRAVSKSSTSNIIQAPSLSVYNGERANITVLQHVTYVKDFEPEIAQSSVIAEPVVAVARDGVILDVRPVVSSDHRFITMELRPTVAILKKDEDGDLPSFTTGLGVGESVTIELPELQVKRLRTTVTMPDGATLLLGGMKVYAETKFDSGLPFFKHIPIISFFLSRKAQYNSKRKLLILVTANIVIPEESEPRLGLKS
ncbi:MAG: hypothetical protein ACYTG7_07915 [Planctomycetota bacterium]|jgi:type II secretory pathway component GspD/PulD (secretin)/Tfp pilus assembly protein PilF